MPDSVVPSGNIADIRAQVEAQIREEGEHFPAPIVVPATPIIDSERIMLCLNSNERGDGILYADLLRDKFIYVKSTEKWLEWLGHHWGIDKSHKYLRAVEDVAMTYLNEAIALEQPITRTTEALTAANLEVTAAKERVKAAKEAANAPALYQADLEAKAAASEASRLAFELAILGKKKKKLMARVDRLRGLIGAKSCATWSHVVEPAMYVIGEELDQRPWLLACENGVIDLQLAELLPGRPSDLLVKNVPVPYLGIDTPCPEWEKLLGSSLPDPEIRLFVQRLFGYAITGFCHEQILACFIGEGSNGKGIIFETIQAIMSELCWRILPEMILEQKTPRTSGSVSSDIVALRGRRIIIASETDEHTRISASKVKGLASEDTMNARGLFVEETNFGPTHTMFIQSNYIPHGLTADLALRRRLVIIPFLYSFVSDIAAEEAKTPSRIGFFKPKDDKLMENLKKEYSGILSWLVRGCVMWQQMGLAPPKQITANIEDHRVSEDYLEQFLNSHCLRPYNPLKTYNQGDMSQVGDDQYVCDKDKCLDKDPVTSPDQWRYIGSGVTSEEWIPFKEFRVLYQSWFVERISEGKKYLPTAQKIGKSLREKGYVTGERGGQNRLYGVRIINREV